MVPQLSIPAQDVSLAEASAFDGDEEIAADTPAVAAIDLAPYRFESFAPRGGLDRVAATNDDATNRLSVRIELGRAQMHLEDALQLGPEALVPLDAPVSGPVDVYIDGRLAARGEVLAVEGCFSVRVTELIS